MGTTLRRGVLAKPAAEVETIAAGNHDVEQKERRRLPFGIGKYLIDRQIGANSKSSAFQMVLHQPGDIRIIFQHKDRLTQIDRPR